MTMPSLLPANWTTGQTFPASSENSVEAAVNWLAYLELNDNFGADSNGAPTAAASGQSYTAAQTTSGAALSVTSGLLSNSNAASSTGWINSTLGGSVTYLEADFAFGSSGSTTNQTLILGASSATLTGTISTITTSPGYVVFGNTGYSVYYWSSSTQTQIGSTISYSAQGTSAQHVEVVIDATNNYIWVRGPDGLVNGFTNSNITGSNTHAVLGAAHTASTDHAVNISRWAASSQLLTNQTPFYYRAQALKQDGVELASTATQSYVTAAVSTQSNPTINGYTEGLVSIGTAGTLGSSFTLSISAGTLLVGTLTSATACTLTMPTAASGKSFVVVIKQPASGTPTTVTFTSVKWPSATAPTLTATVGHADVFTFFCIDGSTWWGAFVQNYTY